MRQGADQSVILDEFSTEEVFQEIVETSRELIQEQIVQDAGEEWIRLSAEINARFLIFTSSGGQVQVGDFRYACPLRIAIMQTNADEGLNSVLVYRETAEYEFEAPKVVRGMQDLWEGYLEGAANSLMEVLQNWVVDGRVLEKFYSIQEKLKENSEKTWQFEKLIKGISANYRNYLPESSAAIEKQGGGTKRMKIPSAPLLSNKSPIGKSGGIPSDLSGIPPNFRQIEINRQNVLKNEKPSSSSLPVPKNYPSVEEQNLGLQTVDSLQKDLHETLKVAEDSNSNEPKLPSMPPHINRGPRIAAPPPVDLSKQAINNEFIEKLKKGEAGLQIPDDDPQLFVQPVLENLMPKINFDPMPMEMMSHEMKFGLGHKNEMKPLMEDEGRRPLIADNFMQDQEMLKPFGNMPESFAPSEMMGHGGGMGGMFGSMGGMFGKGGGMLDEGGMPGGMFGKAGGGGMLGGGMLGALDGGGMFGMGGGRGAGRGMASPGGAMFGPEGAGMMAPGGGFGGMTGPGGAGMMGPGGGGGGGFSGAQCQECIINGNDYIVKLPCNCPLCGTCTQESVLLNSCTRCQKSFSQEELDSVRIYFDL